MKKNNGFSDKVGRFLDGKGFYIALVLCLAVIGGCTYYLIHSLSNLSATVEEAQPASGSAEISVDALVDSPDRFTQEELPEEAEEVVQEDAAQEVSAPQEAEPVSEAESVKVTTWPIQGSVVTAFSPDALVLSETMGDWRTHEGIDLAALAGTNVQAVADGTVTGIDSDLLLGTVMTVSHGDGLTSIYANLDEETLLVELGDKVSAGCVLGQVGMTAAGETSTGDHLHFAMEVNGEVVNPREYLP